MEGGRQKVVQFTAHKRRAGSILSTQSKASKQSVRNSTKAEKDDIVIKDPSKIEEHNENPSLDKVFLEAKVEAANRGHYGNLAYRSYLAKDYNNTIEYAGRQIADGAKKYESLVLRATAQKKLGLIDLSLKDCLACIDINPNNPTPYILAIQCYVSKKDLGSAYKMTLTALQSTRQANPMYKKLISYKEEIVSQQLKNKPLVRAESTSLNWLKVLPLELILTIFKRLPRSDILSMTHTCRAWRSILVRIPELWANVGLDFSSYQSKDKQQYVEFFLQAFLSRANTRLRTITLAHSPKLDWKWFTTLQQFPRPFLTQLSISNTVVSPPFLKPALSAFGTQLTHLTLASCKLTEDSVVLLLSLCPSLIHLDISGQGIPSKELFLNTRGDLRQEYPSLQWLSLAETDAGDDFVSSLGKVFPNLKGINLNRVPNFKVFLLPLLCEWLPKLTEISLQRMGYTFTDRDRLLTHFQTFGATYSMLTHLNLSYNFFLSDHPISCLSDSVSCLKVLDISYTSIGEGGLGVFKNCPHLEYLNLGSCSQITDSAIIAFENSLCIQTGTLKSLDFSGLKLESATIGLIVKAVTDFIIELNLSSSSVNMFGLRSWIDDPPKCLEHLRIKNCPMVSTDFVAKLRTAVPRARIHHSSPS